MATNPHSKNQGRQATRPLPFHPNLPLEPGEIPQTFMDGTPRSSLAGAMDLPMESAPPSQTQLSEQYGVSPDNGRVEETQNGTGNEHNYGEIVRV